MKIRLETAPPLRTQPKSQDDGWRKITLNGPNDKNPDDIEQVDGVPIAPPRRKRSSLAADRQLCGFKELFGNNVSRRSSVDSILKDDNPLTERERELLQQKRKSKSISDFNLNELKPVSDSFTIPRGTKRIPITRTLSLIEKSIVETTPSYTRPVLQRKVSRVGNKKSDKFFGENLSDCLSDEPITPDPDPMHMSLEYHTIDASDSIVPILAAMTSSLNGKDKLDMFLDANVNNNNNNTLNTNQNFIDKDGAKVPEIKEDITLIENVSKETVFNVSSAAADDKKSSLDKKAEFLMAMLDDKNLYEVNKSTTEQPIATPRRSHSKKKSPENEPTANEQIISPKTVTTNNEQPQSPNIVISNDDEELYKGMTPVDEPIIVPRRRPTKHICDDDEHIHKHLHNDQKHSSDEENMEPNTEKVQINIVEAIESEILSPEKPKRDFSIYEKTTKLNTLAPLTATENNIEKPKPRVRHLSQENLMSKQILEMARPKDTIDLLQLRAMSKANQTIDKPKLKKCKSQQSFLTQELMNQIADRVYGFQDPFEHDFCYDGSDDGSSKCTPISKLTTRKISVHRKESTIHPPIQEHLNEDQHSGSKPSENGVNQSKVSVSTEEIRILNTTTKENGADNEKRQRLADTKQNTLELLEAERINSKVLDQTINTVDKQIKIPSHAAGTSNGIQTTPLKKLEKIINTNDPNDEITCEIINHVLQDVYKTNGKILDDFQKYLNDSLAAEQNKIVVNVSEKKLKNSKENISNSSDDENTGSDVTVKEVITIKSTDDLSSDEIKNRLLSRPTNGERRDSIVEVDQWFLKHSDLSDMTNMTRRCSESNTGYNTRKVFPFGKAEPGAGSNFFESKALSKSADNVSESNEKIEIEQKLDRSNKTEIIEQTDAQTNSSSTADHSILLKYLK